MRYIIAALLFLIIVSSDCQNSIAQSIHQAYRPVEGGAERVDLDTVTPLIQLIDRLTQNWHFVETGKAYWIGYTDDMFSIAAYGDKAIKPLTDFIDTSGNAPAKIGALYTLHLIGINAKLVGRFIEDFQNKNARTALLRYLDHRELNQTVVYLLMRDPWTSDVPQFMSYLNLPDVNYATVLSALRRYNIENAPVGQFIWADPIYNKAISFSLPDIDDSLYLYKLIVLQRKLRAYISVDTQITNSPAWLMIKNNSLVHTYSQELTPESFLNFDKISSFCNFSFPYYCSYDYKDRKVKIYSLNKTRQIWLEWWRALPEDRRNQIIYAVHTDKRAK